MIEPAIDEVSAADILVVIGTSLNVYPAAGLLRYAKRNCKMYLIDPKPINVPMDLNIHVIAKGASEGMKELIGMLKD